ncbi:transposase [Streptomyces sp. NPDC127112]|uniref:transposase n=1 Tax=Streptomyces sp. NPDC127112 TaxID=3345364 RepID=UPI003627706A
MADIRDLGLCVGRDVHDGEHAEEEAAGQAQFTADFKAEIVDLCLRGDRSVPDVCKDFDLTESAVRLWLAQSDASHQPKDLDTDEREELAALRRENRRLREDIEVLKRATAFFARGTG